MKSFTQIIEAKVEPNLLRTVPAGSAERHFVSRHTVSDILASFRANKDNSPFDGTVAKIYPRKENHFGNDELESIKSYDESVEINELSKDTLEKYKKAARKSRGENVLKPSDIGNKEIMDKKISTFSKRLDGLKKAKKKLAKEEVETINEFNQPKKLKSRHIYINGKYVGSTEWEPNNKKAVQRWLEVHPNEKNRTKVVAASEGVELSEKHLGFKKLEGKLAKEKGVYDPAGLAAKIGREKLGKKKFQEKAEKAKNESVELSEASKSVIKFASKDTKMNKTDTIDKKNDKDSKVKNFIANMRKKKD